MEPPKRLIRLFRWFCNDEFFEELEGDLEERYYRNLDKKGAKYARSAYRKEVLLMVRPSVIKHVPFQGIVNWAFIFHAFKASLRNLKKHRAYSIMNVVGFAAALSICLFCVNAIYSNQQLDKKFTDKELIYRVNTKSISPMSTNSGTYATSQIPLYEKVQENIPEADKIAIIQNGAWAFETFLKGAKHEFKVSSINEEFFEVLNYEVILGDPNVIFRNKSNVVITEEVMLKYFEPESVIGSVMGPYIIGAVIETPHKVSHLKFDVLANDLKERNSIAFYSSWSVYRLQQMYIKRLANADESTIQDKLCGIAEEINAELEKTENNERFDYQLEKLEDVASSDAFMNQGALLSAGGQKTVLILMLILMGICTFNYTNLAMASAISRTKEIAVRKVMGSQKSALVLQFLAETVLLSLLAFFIGLLLFKWLAPKFATFSDFYFQTSLGLNQVIIFFLFTLFMALFSGFIPGIIFSNTSVLQLFKKTKPKGKLTIKHLKKGLITFQMIISLFVFIVGFILFNQSKLITNQSNPFIKENWVAVQLPTNDSSNFVFRNKLMRTKGIGTVTTIERLPFIQSTPLYRIKKQHMMDDLLASAEIYHSDTSILKLIEDHVTWYGKKPSDMTRPFFLANSLFEKEVSDSVHHVSQGMYSLGNEEYYPVMGEVDNLYSTARVVDPNAAALLIKPEVWPLSFLVELTANSFNTSLSDIQNLYNDQFPGATFQPFFLDDMMAQSLNQFRNIMNAILFVLSSIIVITMMGQIGMSMYMAKTKEKEISIRKILGASYRQIVNLILRSTYLQLIIAALLACPLAYLFYMNAVPSFTIPLEIGVKEFVFGSGFFGLIVLTLITLQTLNTTNQNPTEGLRAE